MLWNLVEMECKRIVIENKTFDHDDGVGSVSVSSLASLASSTSGLADRGETEGCRREVRNDEKAPLAEFSPPATALLVLLTTWLTFLPPSVL